MIATATAIDIDTIKSRHKATWETGDFGQVAKYIMPEAEHFVARLNLKPGMKVLDVACGTGNSAILAARRGCTVTGLDLAENLVEQARQRAAAEGVKIDFIQGDAEALPFADATFDVVSSMWGVMFAPRPERIVSELRRVVKPGGLIAMANWTPDGFLGKVFSIVGRHVPPPAGFPSPLLWGNDEIVRARFQGHADELRLMRRICTMTFPYDPAGTVNFFRRYYGPTTRAFEALKPDAQFALFRELVRLHTEFNASTRPEQTSVHAEYLEVHVMRGSN